jgi:CHASE2 domain-containing sensor protein
MSSPTILKTIRLLLRIVLMLMLLPTTAFAKGFSNDFAVVFIDQASERRFGGFPFDRSIIAQAIERAANAGAKGVVLKFFLDQPRSPSGDEALAKALSRLPVVLQARIDDTEKAANPLPERFSLADPAIKSGVAGSAGWIPLSKFSEPAADVCFVDFAASPVPLIETYQNRPVKSLVLCATELALGTKAVIKSSRAILIGQSEIRVDAQNRISVQVAPDRSISTLPFNDLFDGKLSPATLKNKVVIIGYDGTNIPRIGGVGIHRLFVQYLRAIYEAI